MVRVAEVRGTALNFEKIQTLLEAENQGQPYYGLFLELTVRSGLRCGDLAALKWSSLNSRGHGTILTLATKQSSWA